MNRNDFMEFFRREDFHEHLSDSDRDEVFYGIIFLTSEITKQRLENLCKCYGLKLREVLDG